MPAQKFTTRIIAQEVLLAHSSTTKAGAPYSIYQVRATKPDGTQILWPDASKGEIPLRTFDENFPTNEVVEVTAVLFESAQYGDSYTVSVKGKQGGQTAKKVKELEDKLDRMGERVARIEQTVGEILRDDRPTAATTAPPAAPPPPPPVQQPAGEQFDPATGKMTSSGQPSGEPPPF